MHTLFKRARLSDTIINRSFALLWIGQTISVLGDASFDATLALWIGSITLLPRRLPLHLLHYPPPPLLSLSSSIGSFFSFSINLDLFKLMTYH